MNYIPNVIGIGFIVSSILIGLLVIWIAGIVSCVKSQQMSNNDKILWLLIILFLNTLGSIIYFIIRPDKTGNKTIKKTNKKKKGKTITRNTEKAVLGGVCAGIADYWNLDLAATRILFITLILVTGFFPLVILYIVLWAVMEK